VRGGPLRRGVQEALDLGDLLGAEQIAEVESFLHAPAQWSAAHGGVSAFPSSN